MSYDGDPSDFVEPYFRIELEDDGYSDMSTAEPPQVIRQNPAVDLRYKNFNNRKPRTQREREITQMLKLAQTDEAYVNSLDKRDTAALRCRERWECVAELAVYYPHVKKIRAAEFRVLAELVERRSTNSDGSIPEAVAEVLSELGTRTRVRTAMKVFVRNINKLKVYMPTEVELLSELSGAGLPRSSKFAKELRIVQSMQSGF